MSSPSHGGGAAPKLIVVDPGGARRPPVILTTAGITVGRVEGNDIVLPHDSVSRRHARVDWDGQKASVTDLGSSNGTLVGESRLLAHAAHDWRPGDWLNIGSYFIQLEPPEGVVQPGAAALTTGVSPGPGPTATTAPVAGLAVAAASGPSAPTPPTGQVPPAGPAGGMFESGRIKVTLEANTLSITPGQPAVVRVNIANTGTTVDHLSVSVEGIPESWVRAPEIPSQLNPGGQTTVVLQVNVARIAQNRSGDYPVTVRARSRENPNESGAALALWTLQPFTAGGMTITPTRAHGRSSAKYTLALENGSNTTVRYDFAGKDEEGVLKFAFEPPNVVMEPASTADVRLKLGAPRKLVGSPQTRRFSVQPSSPDGGTPPAPINGELVHKPYIPKWLPPVALAVAVAGAALAYMLLKTEPKAPTIDQFTLEPQQQVVGGQVAVSWSVRDATEVRLDPEVCPNPQPPVGECFFDATNPGEVEVNLVAINEDANSERARTVTVREPDPTDPTVTVAASVERIVAGDEVTITWEASNYDHVTLRFSGQAAEFGPDDDPGLWTDKPQQTTIYTVEVTNQGKVAKRSVKVEVDPAPTATALPATLPPDATATTPAQPTATVAVMPTATMPVEPTPTMPAMPTPTVFTSGGPIPLPGGATAVEIVGGAGVDNVLYALTETRIMRSPDGGLTWEDVGPRQNGEMVVALNNPDVLYAGERNACDETNPGTQPLVRSTDGGRTWPDAFPNATGTRPLLVSAGQDSIVIADDCNLLFSFSGGEELFFVDPLGSGYQPTDAAASDPSLREFVAVALNQSDSAVVVFDMSDPSGTTFVTSPSFFFSAELDWADGRLAAATDYGVMFSDDNGETWSEYLRNGLDGVVFDVDPGAGLPFFRDADIGLRDIVVDPTNRERMWLASNRGVYLTENGGQTWNLVVQQADVQSLGVSIANDRLFVSSPRQTTVFTLNGG